MQLFTLLFDLAALTGIAWWLYKQQPDTLKIFYWPALLCKVAAGIMVGLLYFYYYGAGDTISYWRDGQLIAARLTYDPVGTIDFYMNDSPGSLQGLVSEKPRSLFFVKISGLLALASGGNYWMMSVILSLASFFGAWYLFSKINRFFPQTRIAAAVGFLFFPSVVFWSSGLIKESVGLGALFILTGMVLSIIKREKIYFWEWCLALVSLWLGWTLKYYWMGVFLPVAVTTMGVTTFIRSRPAFGRFELPIWAGLFMIVLLVATSVHPNFYPHRFFDVISQSNLEFMALTRADNAIHYNNLQPTFLSILQNAPWALVAGLFRPFVWEFHNLPSFAAGVENLALLLLVLMSLPSLTRFYKGPEKLLALSAIVYIGILSVFLALATPNLGTLSRYKIGFLPFLVFLTLLKSPIMKWVEGKKLG